MHHCFAFIAELSPVSCCLFYQQFTFCIGIIQWNDHKDYKYFKIKPKYLSMSRSSGFGQSKLYQNTLYSILYTVYMCVHYGFFRRACQNLAGKLCSPFCKYSMMMMMMLTDNIISSPLYCLLAATLSIKRGNIPTFFIIMISMI